MASQKKQIPVSGTNTTTDNVTWVTIATATVSVDASIPIKDIWVSGRNTANGASAYAEANHRGKRVSGTLSLIGSIVFYITFNTGSDAAMSVCDARINVSGNDLQLQVTGVVSTTIEWYGGFTVVLN